MTNEIIKEELLKEIERVQKVQAIYMTIPTGTFAAILMSNSIEQALKAIETDKPLELLEHYLEDLKGYHE